jgi:CRP-like cAMP-binding protein
MEDESRLLQSVLGYGIHQAFAPEEPILAPGTDTDAFYYVIKGTVEVSYTDNHDTRITVALIGQGEFFGEIGFFDGESRVRDIRAIENAEIAIFNGRVMDRLQQAAPHVCMDFLVFLTQKICRKFRRIAGEREPSPDMRILSQTAGLGGTVNRNHSLHHLSMQIAGILSAAVLRASRLSCLIFPTNFSRKRLLEKRIRTVRAGVTVCFPR